MITVPVSEGTNRVELVYVDLPLFLGAVVSLCSAGIIGAVIILNRKKRAH